MCLGSADSVFMGELMQLSQEWICYYKTWFIISLIPFVHLTQGPSIVRLDIKKKPPLCWSSYLQK